MRKKKQRGRTRGLALLTALLLLVGTLGSAIGAMAADTINTNATGSITIYKYDWTAASAADSSLQQSTGTGEQLTDTSALSTYALAGVTFTYLKVGDIATYETTNTDGTVSVEVVYSLPDALAVTILGLSKDSQGITISGSSDTYYTADAINTALANKLSGTANTATKNALEAYIKNTSNGTATSMEATDTDGKTSATGLALGLYLIVETSVPENVQSTTDPFLVSLPMTESDGTDWNYNVYVYPKNQTNNPTVDKLVKSDETTATYADTATASVGDILTYRVVSKLPTITSTATYLDVYTFTDRISGLAYVEDYNVKIELYKSGALKTEVEQGTAAADTTWYKEDSSAKFAVAYTGSNHNQMTITMNTSAFDVINPDYSDGYVVVTYTAKLLDSAVLGDNGNPNDVTLTYSRTSDSSYDIKDESIVYSYGLKLVKTFADGSTDKYSSVTFTLANKTDGKTIYAVKDSDGVYTVTAEATGSGAVSEFSPNSSTGILTIYGLEADTYTLTETDTANGYSLLASPIEIAITPTSATITPTVKAATGSTAAMTVTVTTTDASADVDSKDTTMSSMTYGTTTSTNALVDLSVINTKSFTLPQTGGLGTILFTIGGALVVILGAVYLTRGKKKSAEQ